MTALDQSECGPRQPIITVIMANYNGSAYLRDAISSVQKQTLKEIEIIVSDDASSDDSVDIVKRLMAGDPRIRLVTSDRNNGPARARNRALELARGEWIAIVDSDDLIHPTRLGTLIESARRDGTDIVADDLLIFGAPQAPTTVLKGRWARAPFWVDIAEYIELNQFYGRGPTLGYLKPLFSSDLIAKNAVRYDENLTVGEDYNFVLKLLRAGARFRVYPQLQYFYRKHTASFSHRLWAGALEALKAADLSLIDMLTPAERGLRPKLDARVRSIDRALAFEEIMSSLKAREWIKAARAGIASPGAFLLLRLPVAARLRRLWTRPERGKSNKRQVCVLSRQRVTGRTNGSSVYLLDLVAAIEKKGCDVHLLCPSPTTLGRWPYLALSDDLSIFKTIRIRGTWRLGRRLISADPRRFVQGAVALCDRTLLKLGLTKRAYSRRARYSIAQPMTRQDQLFVAKHGHELGDFLIADYCFLTEAFPYVLRPDAGTAAIMHDRISSRPGQFEAVKRHDVETVLTEREECDLLGRADCVLAIQEDEADFIRGYLPDRRIIVAPMAAYPVEVPQPGHDDQVLFVGSAAAPNVDGLSWFIDHCWGRIRKSCPHANFLVIGTVSQFMPPMSDGIRAIGFVKDLEPLYEGAGVIISPLRIGSGLKIKLIEALSRGKSVVGTSKTLQGVENHLAGTIIVEDKPEPFADAVIRLLNDRQARISLALRGLDQLRKQFTPDKCYGAFVEEVVDHKFKVAPHEPSDMDSANLRQPLGN
jgi:GT2 family glycosyltransferase/glycosyltransferase involved in cell wall biosynthesis